MGENLPMSETEQKNIRLLLIDDHALFREGVARLLESEPGFEVVAQCGSGTEALEVMETSKEIDIVLTDLGLGQERGTDFLDRLREVHFKGKALVVTGDVSDAELCSLIRKGISGVFLKHVSPTVLIQGIRETMEGMTLFGQDQLRRAFARAKRHSADQRRSPLTDRERQVLSLVFDGLGNREIGGSIADFRDHRQSFLAAAVHQDWR
jgi:two-component system, NarL family, nitrate/nitrite response regulator NarL